MSAAPLATSHVVLPSHPSRLRPAPPQVPVPSDLPDEAACQALINPVTVIGMFQMIDVPKGGSWCGVGTWAGVWVTA